MKLITRNSDYAIRALLYVSQHPKKIFSAQELTRALNMPRALLRSVLQKLSRGGYLDSARGKDGGFSLRVNAASIKISEIIMLFQGSIEINECTLKKKICPNLKNCVLRRKIKDIEELVISKLSNITIGSLVIDADER